MLNQKITMKATMMNNETLKIKAKELAIRRYTTIVFRDETTDDEPIYVAIIPELEGCSASGDTPQEASENLKSAKEDFIYFLLEDGLDVPEPQLIGTHTTITISEWVESTDKNHEISLGNNNLIVT